MMRGVSYYRFKTIRNIDILELKLFKDNSVSKFPFCTLS